MVITIFLSIIGIVVLVTFFIIKWIVKKIRGRNQKQSNAPH